MTDAVSFGTASNPTFMAAPGQPDMAGAKKLNDAIASAMEHYNKALAKSQAEAQGQFEQAYSTYASGFQALQDDLQKQGIEAYRTFIEALQKASTQSEAVEKCVASYEQYVQILSSALHNPEQQKLSQEAYNDLLAQLGGLTEPDSAGIYNKAVEAYTEKLQTIWDLTAVTDKAEQAHTNYVSQLQDLYQSIDSDIKTAIEVYVQTLSDIWQDPAITKQTEALIEEYSKDTTSAWTGTVDALKTAANEATEIIKAAWPTQ